MGSLVQVLLQLGASEDPRMREVGEAREHPRVPCEALFKMLLLL